MRSLKIVVLFCGLAVCCGCAFQKYHPAPLSPSASALSLRTRTLDDANLRAFLESRLPGVAREWPLKQWSLRELTLAALYYSPELLIARARLAEAEAAVVTARGRPNPSAGGFIGGETAPESPWVAGITGSLPIETAGKRGYRISAAQRTAEVAGWTLASTAWSVRAQVRSALLEYITARQNFDLLQKEESVRAQQVELLEQRLAVGMIPRPQVDAARIQHTQVLFAVRAAEGRAAQAETALAAAIGVSTSALNAVTIVWPGVEQPPSAESLSPSTIQQDAVLNRIDIRRALAEYTAAETALRSEIARQYPDINLGPDYAFEEGAHLFSVALDLALPVFNRNQGPIAEARARREEMAAQFVAVQAAGIAQSEHALARYTSALKQLAQSRQLMRQSLALQNAAQRALQAGAGDRVALNGAQLATTLTAVAQLDALYEAQQALGDLENAVQRPLLPGDIPALNPQSAALNPADTR